MLDYFGVFIIHSTPTWLTCVGDRFACVDTRGTLVYVLIQRTFVAVCRVDWRFSLLVSLGSVLQQWDWDMWMRTNFIRKDRECIIPDISRTFHFGSKGLNMNPYFQDLYFKKHSIVSHAGAVLKDVDKLVTVCVCVWDSVCLRVCVFVNEHACMRACRISSTLHSFLASKDQYKILMITEDTGNRSRGKCEQESAWHKSLTCVNLFLVAPMPVLSWSHFDHGLFLGANIFRHRLCTPQAQMTDKCF